MYEIDKNKFGIFVAELRKKKGYTQKEIAKHLHISDKAISKWETGVSIPDTSLLIPLADLLEVSVTELLMCEHIQKDNTMDFSQVDNIVKTVVTYSDKDLPRAYQEKGNWKWGIIYIISIFIGGIGTLFNYLYNRNFMDFLITLTILGLILGIYFIFFVKIKLPSFYDENKVNIFNDGIFHMRVIGVYFNNSNWPYIVLVCRIWSCLIMSLFPIITILLSFIWYSIALCILLILLLGGLFIPIYIVGKKFE